MGLKIVTTGYNGASTAFTFLWKVEKDEDSCWLKKLRFNNLYLINPSKKISKKQTSDKFLFKITN